MASQLTRTVWRPRAIGNIACAAAGGIKNGMRIAIVGPGGIGSTFAFQLSRAGHHVTVVARGGRLEQLRRDEAIVTTEGERAAVEVSAELDATTPWDLALVSVLVSQVDALLPALSASAAKSVMFMFNTFESLDRLRDAVGAQRFSTGFPAIVASLGKGRLSSTILRRGMSTTVSDPLWASVFSDAGIPTTVHPDMQSWLRTHAAVIVPLAIAGSTAQRRGGGIPRVEAVTLARAMAEGLRLVRHLGNTITPASIAVLSHLPVPALAALLWMLTRWDVFVRTIAVAPAGEPRMLIDEMSAAWAGHTPALLAVRP
jgi:2-dehydropantoate 2-reductase